MKKTSLIILFGCLLKLNLYAQIVLPFNFKDSTYLKNGSLFTGVELFKDTDANKESFHYQTNPTFFEYYFSQGKNVKIVARFSNYLETRTFDFPIAYTINLDFTTTEINDSLIHWFYPSGILYQSIPILNNKISGSLFTYFETGYLQSIECFYKNELTGPIISFFNNKNNSVNKIIEHSSGEAYSRIVDYDGFGYRRFESLYEDNYGQKPIPKTLKRYNENGKIIKK
jgi:antitoxin component YwqK of YwqJK toxin-antitoxin module